MFKFIILDDHPLARLAIRSMLEKEGHCVLAETGEGLSLFQLVKDCNPDGLIVDIDLPDINGIDVIMKLRSTGFRLPVLVMSGKNADYYAAESIKAGANGFVSKQNHLDDLSNAIKAIFSGYSYFPFRVNLTNLDPRNNEDGKKIQLLSKREFEVLKFLAEGKEIVAIACRMKISNKTVSTYKARLMDKLGLKNQRDLLEFTRRNQIS